MNPSLRLLQRLTRFSLAQQLVLLALLPAMVATLGAIAVLTRQHLASVTDLMRANAQTVALQVATSAQAPLAQLDRRALLRAAQSGSLQPHVRQVQIALENGEILAKSEASDQQKGRSLGVTAPVAGENGRSIGKVMVEISLDAVDKARRSILLDVLVLLAVTLAGVGLAGWWAARRIGAPINRLGEAVDRLGAGEEVSVAIEGTAEMRRLQNGFNEAARALADSWRLLQSRIAHATAELESKNIQLEVASQAKTRLLAAASHDLRQPLHALTLFSDGLANGETDPVRLQRIGHIRECVASLDRLAAGEPVQVPLEGTAEVRHLQQGFNAAATALHDGRQLLEQRVREATAELAEKNRAIEQASQAKTRLLAAASHDLRQPLHALTLFSEGLARDEPDPARQQRIRHVRECVASLDHLFAELLNISQIDAGVLQPRHSDFALDRLFDDVSRNFRPVAEAQHLRLVVRHTDLWVRSDYFMLSRIVGNLVANAVRYTPHGGVLVAARRRGPRVRIDVIDTGIGIAPEHQQRIFDEFYQVRSGAETAGRGTGLGLATVQRLAGLLGLQIGLTSAPGRGARFHFEVPMAAPEPAGAPAADEAAVLPMPCDGRAPLAHDGRVVPAAPLPAPVPPGQEAPLAVA